MKTGEMKRYKSVLDAPKIIPVAVFWTIWIFFTRHDGRPERRYTNKQTHKSFIAATEKLVNGVDLFYIQISWRYIVVGKESCQNWHPYL